MFGQPLSFLSGQSRYCGARFVVRRAGGKNNLKMPLKHRLQVL